MVQRKRSGKITSRKLDGNPARNGLKKGNAWRSYEARVERMVRNN